VYLGTDVFVETMRRRLEEDVKYANKEIPRTQRRALAKSLAYYRDEFDDAKQGMIAAYATGDYTLQAIAEAFAVHYATVSRAVNGK
jgi:rRNA maturation endonuclease Nob1